MEQILNHPEDTICAVSTPAGTGGIAVIRISGPEAITITDRIWHGRPIAKADTHTAHLGHIVEPDGQVLDHALATVFRSPGTFTGEDVVEISVHGSVYIQTRLLQLLCQAGARLAGPGEFTRRAFANGRLDLAQAEAVADIIAASSSAAHRLAVTQLSGAFSSHIETLRQSLIQLASLLELELDFSEEDVTFVDRGQLRTIAADIQDRIRHLSRTFSAGDAIRRGIPVAIVGEPNAGKSSLLNALLGHERAIVSDIPGTTRDTVEETITLGRHLFRFIDTAGLRDTADPIERLGITRALDGIATAHIVIWLIPACADPVLTDIIANRLRQNLDPATHLITCRSKSDLSTSGQHTPTETLPISIRRPETIDNLRIRLEKIADDETAGTESEGMIVTNARHYQALEAAAASLTRVIQELDTGAYTDLIAQDLRETLHHLATITGAITTDTLLTTIFTRFCIGK